MCLVRAGFGAEGGTEIFSRRRRNGESCCSSGRNAPGTRSWVLSSVVVAKRESHCVRGARGRIGDRECVLWGTIWTRPGVLCHDGLVFFKGSTGDCGSEERFVR